MYEDSESASENGTLKLLCKFLSGRNHAVSAIDLHSIRKEFLKLVFSFYIIRHLAVREDEGRLILSDDNTNSDNNAHRTGDMLMYVQTANAVIRIIDSMREKDVYKLYEKLAIETRKRLESTGLLPEGFQSDLKGRSGDSYQNTGATVNATNKSEHLPLKQIVAKLI